MGAAISWKVAAAETVTLPFDNGERPLVKYPQKRPLIRLTTRPPQLETPFSVFNQGVLTPNDAFFVRYHLTLSPPPEDVLKPDVFRVSIGGAINSPLKFSVAQLKQQFENVEVVAVNQCSGNSRGFSNPRVTGGQLGHGAMGNARWRGVRLRDVLNKAGVAAGAKQVSFDGFWMSAAYHIPDNSCACVPPGSAPTKTVPIARYNVRSFITSLANGAQLNAGSETMVKGIAFDGGYGISEVVFSSDGGRTWREAELGKDIGRYSFREWTIPFRPARRSAYELKIKATNRIGQSQPREPLWNPAGYMRNVIETVRVEVA